MHGRVWKRVFVGEALGVLHMLLVLILNEPKEAVFKWQVLL